MAELAGYYSESADKWRKKGEAVDVRTLKKEILKQRIRVYITALFAAFTLLQVFWLVYIHDDQVEWYANEVKRMNEEAGQNVNSMLFFHIPLQEYKTATELYLEGSNEVKYFFGGNPGDHGGITNELVCCSDYPSKIFDKAVELGGTTAMFCGHDHYNNASLEYKGIRLTYGMSIDYLAMPGISKETKLCGAELITIHDDSTLDLEQITLKSIVK